MTTSTITPTQSKTITRLSEQADIIGSTLAAIKFTPAADQQAMLLQSASTANTFASDLNALAGGFSIQRTQDETTSHKRLIESTIDAFDAANLGHEIAIELAALLDAIVTLSDRSSTVHSIAQSARRIAGDRIELMRVLSREYDKTLAELRGAA